MFAIIAIILLVAIIQIAVIGVFSNSVEDLWQGASEDLAAPQEVVGPLVPKAP